MTPSFYVKYEILKRTLEIFNARCSCEKVAITISISLIANTREEDMTWVGHFKSDVFGDETFQGTLPLVLLKLENHIKELSLQILESIAANAFEWYADKPEIKSEIPLIYDRIKKSEES